jgi:hypothetical protein
MMSPLVLIMVRTEEEVLPTWHRPVGERLLTATGNLHDIVADQIDRLVSGSPHACCQRKRAWISSNS